MDVAAVGKSGGGKQWKKAKPKQQQASGKSMRREAPADMARLTTGLCIYHFTFGGRAHSCKQPFSWQPGN